MKEKRKYLNGVSKKNLTLADLQDQKYAGAEIIHLRDSSDRTMPYSFFSVEKGLRSPQTFEMLTADYRRLGLAHSFSVSELLGKLTPSEKPQEQRDGFLTLEEFGTKYARIASTIEFRVDGVENGNILCRMTGVNGRGLRPEIVIVPRKYSGHFDSDLVPGSTAYAINVLRAYRKS